MYTKDVNFKENSVKSNLLILSKSSEEVSNIEKEFYINEGINFDNELDV